VQEKTGLARAVLSTLGPASVPVVTGFVGSTPSGETTLLGCGASDLTAAILGWALNAERVEILNLRIPRRLQRVRT
jgi:aspartokinase